MLHFSRIESILPLIWSPENDGMLGQLFIYVVIYYVIIYYVIICQQLFMLTINKSTLFTDTKKLILFFSGIEGEQRVQEGMFSGFWFEVDN